MQVVKENLTRLASKKPWTKVKYDNIYSVIVHALAYGIPIVLGSPT